MCVCDSVQHEYMMYEDMYRLEAMVIAMQANNCMMTATA